MLVNSRFKGSAVVGFAALLSTFGSVGQATETQVEKDAYQLVVVSRAAGTRALLNGHLSAAERMAQQDTWSTSTARNFQGHLTQCVALIKQDRLGRAERACAHAVRSSVRAQPSRAQRSPNVALAKVARGVLRALQGRSLEAQDDFAAAVAAHPDMAAAKHNLAMAIAGPAHSPIDAVVFTDG